MTELEFEVYSAIIDDCLIYEDDMDEKDHKFYGSMSDKFNRYGERAFVSADQDRWLKDLYLRYVPSEDQRFEFAASR